MSKVEIAEMRKFLQETTVRPIGANREKSNTFTNAPDWVVRRLYEIRNNLPLTALPDAAYKTVSKAQRGAKLTEQERMKLQLIVVGLA